MCAYCRAGSGRAKMIQTIMRGIDSFIPHAAQREKSDLTLMRNFVFTHLCGPFLGQAIVVFLFLADQQKDYPFWVIEICIVGFWALAFLLQRLGRVEIPALISCQLLIFVSLFGAFFYGGMSSPFLPWLLVGLLLGFFYLSDRPFLILGGMVAQCVGFLIAYIAIGGFPDMVPIAQLGSVSLISVLGAFVYMAWMSVFYASVIQQRSELEREAERERQTANRLRGAMEAAEQANRAKSIFLAKMSHELRTPLNAVIGYSEMLLDEVADRESSESKLRDLERINAAGRHLLSLVTDVLDVSRIESETIEVDVSGFAIDAMISDIVATAEQLAKAHANRFSVVAASDLGMASTDHRKLRQCLLNLIGNAAKFTHNGTITLRVSRRGALAGDEIVFKIEDTGMGISKEKIDKLFQAFGQADSSIARDFGGTGLGLALTRQFCSLMGGDVTVQSEPGRGSCFTIVVPADFVAHQIHDESSLDPRPVARAA
jgi:signal transduction histidine kinase